MGHAQVRGKDVSSTPSVCWTRRQRLWRRGGVHHTGDQDTSPLSTRRYKAVVNHGPDGMALTREENEVINAKDEREGKQVARQLAPMISKIIRAQWESEELKGVDHERRQTLEEAAELDHIWGVWEAEEEPTNVPGRWIRQPSRNRDDMRHHVEVQAHTEKRSGSQRQHH
jgi:hypothetical protein